MSACTACKNIDCIKTAMKETSLVEDADSNTCACKDCSPSCNNYKYCNCPGKKKKVPWALIISSTVVGIIIIVALGMTINQRTHPHKFALKNLKINEKL